MKSFRLLCLLIVGNFFLAPVFAQTNPALVITVKPDHENWVYQLGEKAKFKISVSSLATGGKPLKLKFQIGPEKMVPFKSDSIMLTSNEFVVEGYTLKKPGFLRCTVTAEWEGKTVKGMATAAYSPELIKPTVSLPTQFTSFWDNSIRELAKIPLNSTMDLWQEASTENTNVYQVSFQNIHNSRVFGILCVPKKPGKYPVVLKVPGAGVRGYKGDKRLAEKGVITLEIGIHGVPVAMKDEVYVNMSTGPLYSYNILNLDNKNAYYYNRVYLGCVRAIDFLVSLPQYDGTNVAIYGGSQGGALSIVTAALDKRIKYLGAYYPALSDMTGYLHNRAGGWPHMLNVANVANHRTKDKLETISYYDVVNFAKQLSIPGYYSWGYNDETCPPTSMYAAYNVISAPKELNIFKETGHNTVPAQTAAMEAWLLSKIKKP
jgi:cephalosporin-C deacetylase